jgi:hypothetical protein
MARFTDQERAEIYAESCRLLEDKPPAPTPTPEPPLVFENIDPVQKWREHADAFERQRAAARAKLQAERAAARADWSAWNAYIDARVAAALAERQHEIVELAHSSVEFATAVDRKLAELERLLTKLSATHNELREHVAREPLDMPSPLVRKERLIN